MCLGVTEIVFLLIQEFLITIMWNCTIFVTFLTLIILQGSVHASLGAVDFTPHCWACIDNTMCQIGRDLLTTFKVIVKRLWLTFCGHVCVSRRPTAAYRQCRSQTTRALAHRRNPPVPTWNLSFVFILWHLKMQKSQTLEKEYFFQIEMTVKEF